jgi:hypothetical protein
MERAITAELCARDEKRSGGRICAANGWKVTTGHPSKPNAHVIDPELRAIKHTRREERLRLNAEWAEFCSAPRSEKDFESMHVAANRAASAKSARERYEAEFGGSKATEPVAAPEAPKKRAKKSAPEKATV